MSVQDLIISTRPTKDSEAMTEVEAFTDRGVKFVDWYTDPEIAAEMVVLDSGRILIPTEGTQRLIDTATKQGLSLS